MPRPLPQAKQHPDGRREILIILVTDPFDLVFLFLNKRVKTPKVQLRGLRILECLDEWCERFEVFGGAVGFIERDLQRNG